MKMKHGVLKIFLVALYLCIALCCNIKAQNWTVINTGTTNTLWGISFADNSTGWIIGSSGLIKKTTNGGTNWISQSSGTTETLRRIRMVNVNTGFVCGHNGTIIRTTNGGTNWILNDLGTASYYSLFLGSVNRLVGDDRNYAGSVDNGATWFTGILNGVTDNPDIYGIHQISSTNMYICTQASGSSLTPRIYRSTSSGSIWNVSLQFPEGVFSNTDLNDILFFMNSATGFSAGSNGYIVRTTDSGSNWNETSVGNFNIRQLSNRGSSIVFACGSGGNFAVTPNAGLNWSLITTGVTSAELNSVCNTSLSPYEFRVWCCGTNGTVIKSDNGGGIFRPPSNLTATTVSNTKLSLNWQDNTLIEDKFLIFRSPNNFNYTLRDTTAPNVSSYVDSALTSNSRYYYIIIAASGLTWTAASPYTSAVTLLDTPQLLSPGNGSINLSTAPVLSCSLVSGATYYRLQISTDSQFTSVIFDDSSFANNYMGIQSGTLGYGIGYYWRVKGISTSNYSRFSAARNFTTISCNASSSSWVTSHNGNGNGDDLISKVVTDAGGHVYCAGRTWSNLTSDFDYITNKYNSDGILLWSKTYNGTGNNNDFAMSMAVDTSGNIVVTGLSYDSQNADYLTIKYDREGNILWANRYNASGFWDVATSVVLDDSGNVYVTGQSYVPATSHDIVTIKYNSYGVQQWLQRYSGAGAFSDEGKDMCIDVSGGIIITGLSYKNGNYDFVTLKYSSGGSQLWSATYNGTGNSDDFSNSVCTDHSGNIYITGQSTGSGSAADYLTIKYNSTGTQQWAARHNGSGNADDIPRSIEVDKFGNIAVTGSSTGVGSGYDHLTVKYDSGGLELWARRYNGTGNSADEAFEVTIDNSGNFFVTGYSRTGAADSTENIITTKYDSEGNLLKSLSYSGDANGEDNAYCIDLDCMGNVYAAGFVTGANEDILLTKYRSSDFINQQVLNLSVVIEGLYSGQSSVADTVMVYLSNSTTPFAKVDSSLTVLNNQGICSAVFSNASDGTPYFVSVEHRNTIETWSALYVSFTLGVASYDFTLSASQAYGGNMILKGTEYCLYSGDVNSDDIVDATDAGAIDNDAGNFIMGYVVTDLNGDEIVDASDAVFADNNAANFVSAVIP